MAEPEIYYCKTKTQPWGLKKYAFVIAAGPAEAAYRWCEQGLGHTGEIEVFNYTARERGVIHDLERSCFAAGKFPSNLVDLAELVKAERTKL